MPQRPDATDIETILEFLENGPVSFTEIVCELAGFRYKNQTILRWSVTEREFINHGDVNSATQVLDHVNTFLNEQLTIYSNISKKKRKPLRILEVDRTYSLFDTRIVLPESLIQSIIDLAEASKPRYVKLEESIKPLIRKLPEEYLRKANIWWDTHVLNSAISPGGLPEATRILEKRRKRALRSVRYLMNKGYVVKTQEGSYELSYKKEI